MVNYRITNILYVELRLLYKHQGLHKSILHNHVNSIMLKLNIQHPIQSTQYIYIYIYIYIYTPYE